MFGLSMWELIIIALVILFVVGPKRLPDIAKSIGKGYGEFKRTFNEMKQTVNIDDNNVTHSRNQPKNDNKIQTYAEQYKSQWEEKFDTEETPRTSKIEQQAVTKNSDENKG